MVNKPRPSTNLIGGGKVRGKGEANEGTLKGVEYDRHDFYVRSIDDNKNRDSTRVDSMKCPPYLSALVNKWVNDPRTPYTSASDFWRDAGAHRAHDLEEWAEDPSFDWGYLGLAERRDRLAREAKDMNSQTEVFQQDITTALNQRDYVWLKELVEVGKEAVGRFREPYRSRVEDIIKPYMDGSVLVHGKQ